MIMKIVVAISICLCMFALYANANDNIAKRFQKKYSQITSIAVKFRIDNQKEILSVKAKKGNKFVLEQKSSIVYCDGTTVWNYNTLTNKCMISRRDIHNETTSIDDVFLGVLQSYVIEKIMTINKSDLGNGYMILMKPRSKEDMIHGIESVQVTVDKKTLQLQSLQFKDNAGNHTIIISSLRVNEKMDNAEFTFTPSKSVTVIDLR